MTTTARDSNKHSLILPSTVAYEIIAGSVTGAVEASITYPLDYIKTRSQLLNTRPASLPGLGPWKTALNHYKTEHIGLFYKGLSALALGNIAKSGVRFTGYEIFRVNLADEKGKLTVPNTFFAAISVGCLETMIVVAPFENIKTKMVDSIQSGDARYRSFFGATSNILLEDGALGMYRGLIPLMLRQCAGALARFWGYTTLRSEFEAGYNPGGPIPSSVIFALGGFASASSTYLTMPFDVVKTRMQSISASKHYHNFLHCAYRIATEEGILQFWKGSTPRLLRMTLSGALNLVLFESS